MEAFKKITAKVRLANTGYQALNRTLKGRASYVYTQVNHIIEKEKNAGFRQKYRRFLALLAILSFFIALTAGIVGLKRWRHVRKGHHELQSIPSHYARKMHKDGLTDSVWMNGPLAKRKARNVMYDDQLRKCVLKVRQEYRIFSQEANKDTVRVTVREMKGYKIVGVICSTLNGLDHNMKYNSKRKLYTCICKGRNEQEAHYITDKLKAKRDKGVFNSMIGKDKEYLGRYLSCFAHYLICPSRK